MDKNNAVLVRKRTGGFHILPLVFDKTLHTAQNHLSPGTHIHFFNALTIANSAIEGTRVIAKPLVVWRKVAIVVQIVALVCIKCELTPLRITPFVSDRKTTSHSTQKTVEFFYPSILF